MVIVTVGIIYGLIKCFWHTEIKAGLKSANAKFLLLAKSIDKYGNVACSELFNDLLLSKDSKWKFGYIEETISGVLGVNYNDGTLSKTGKFICNILNKIDKGHVQRAAILDKLKSGQG